MAVNFKLIYSNAWKSDVASAAPIGTAPTPLPMSTAFPTYFNNIKYTLGIGATYTLNDIYYNLRIDDAGGANTSFFASWTPGTNNNIGALNSVVLGIPAVYATGPVYTGTILPDFSYNPLTVPDEYGRFLYYGDDNVINYHAYDFNSETLELPPPPIRPTLSPQTGSGESDPSV